MAGTRKARVPMAEQIKLINECRQSGMTDADWCRENDIAVSTFTTGSAVAGKRQRDQILPPNYGHLEAPRPKQDVVPIDIVPEHIPEQHAASQMQKPSTRARRPTTPRCAKELASMADDLRVRCLRRGPPCPRLHRRVAAYLPAVSGFLIQKELEIMGGALANPKRPLVVTWAGPRCPPRSA